MSKHIVLADFLETYLFGEDVELAKELESRGWTFTYFSKTDVESVARNSTAVLCVPYGKFDPISFKTDKNIIIYKTDDLYPNPGNQAKSFSDADLVLSSYAYLIKDIPELKQYSDKTVFFPHFAITNYFNNIEINKSPKRRVLVTGATLQQYPFRNHVMSLSRVLVSSLTHPGYGTRPNGNGYWGKDYYKQLNNYICGFTDTLKFKYIVAKAFEIPASGSLLLIEDTLRDQLSQLGFIDMENCIMCNQNNVRAKIKWILNPSNADKVSNITRSGYDMVRKNHNTSVRADMIEKLFEVPSVGIEPTTHGLEVRRSIH